MKLYIFGDSFSADYRIEESRSWPALWASLHNIESVNYSLPGCSNAYIFSKLIEVLPAIDASDVVIIVWSTFLRLTKFENDWINHINEEIWADEPSQRFLEDLYSEDNLYAISLAQIIASCKLLDTHGIKYQFFLGHNDKESSYIQNQPVMHHAYRARPDNDLLFDYTNSLPKTWCILHEWFVLQLSQLTNQETNYVKNLFVQAVKVDNYDQWTADLFAYLTDIGKNIFIDVWHLNEYGHTLFAEYLNTYLNSRLL